MMMMMILTEGWHSSLNSQFGVPHPSLRVFLHWLQQCQFQVQSRAMQLTSRRSPKPRKKEYVQVDSDLWAAKVEFSQTIGWIFATAQQLTWDWSMKQFQCVSYHYLRRCTYLLGCWLRTRPMCWTVEQLLEYYRLLPIAFISM